MKKDNTSFKKIFIKIIDILCRQSLKGIVQRVRTKLHTGKETLIELEKAGIQAVPFNFYSPIPSVSDIENGWEAQTPHPFLSQRFMTIMLCVISFNLL